jgi:hypothetical protein
MKAGGPHGPRGEPSRQAEAGFSEPGVSWAYASLSQVEILFVSLHQSQSAGSNNPFRAAE